MRAKSGLLRFGKFNLVGLIGTGWQLLLVWWLTKRLHMSAVGAMAVAVEIVILHNYVWHERFTWRDRRVCGMRYTIARLWRFHAGNGLVSLVGNTLLTYCFVTRLRLPVLPSAIAAIGICSLANFILADRWVYSMDPGWAVVSRNSQLAKNE